MPKPGRAGPERAAWDVSRRRLPTIPGEIFLKIFSYIQVSIEMESAECTQILSQLSLVCSFFCAALRPRLFSMIKLNARDKRTNSPSVAFCRALLRGDARAQRLADHVRNCRISYWLHRGSVGSSARAETALITLYRRVLHRVLNIEILSLTSSKVDSGMWEAVGRFSKLKTLWMSDVSFPDNVPAEEADHIAALRLSNFSVIYSRVSPLPQLINPAALFELSGDHNSLDTLLANGSTSTLETLTVYRPIEARPLINILAKVSSIRTLTVFEFAMENLGVTLQDFSALLPNLRSLTCSPLLISLLAPGRPLTYVRALYARSSDPLVNLDAILGFYDPKNTIIELNIPPITTDEAPATSYFPCLRKVVLRLPLLDPRHYEISAAGLKSLIVNSCSRWAGNPSIQQVVIPTNIFVEYLVTNLALQHAILVEILSHAFPALLRFQLDECVVWERFAASDAWRVLLVAKHRAGLVARLEAGDPGVVDYDGYLQRLSVYKPKDKKHRISTTMWAIITNYLRSRRISNRGPHPDGE